MLDPKESRNKTSSFELEAIGFSTVSRETDPDKNIS